MRFSFPNLVRPKKSAKIISRMLGLPLSHAQSAIAHICGYGDWYDLANSHGREPAFALDQSLDQPSYIARQTHLILKLAANVRMPDGDAQVALTDSHLTGDRPISLQDQIALRLSCLRQTELPWAARRSRGAVGILNSPGRKGEVVILKSFGQPTAVITHKNVGNVGDFEFVSSRNPLPLFLPMRLYLPYGHWIEMDGSKVLFSRDYKPMWRIRDGLDPERLNPSLWIRFRDQVHYWDDTATPWRVPEVRQNMEGLLTSLGLRLLPIWADVLPIAIRNQSVDSFADALEPLMEERAARQKSAA